MPKPIPVPDEVSKPFWDAVNERRLVVQTCTACDRRQYPPQETCTQCRSADHLEWREVKGRGKINGYCVMYDSRIVPLQADQPFNIAVIELEEDPEIKFLSHLPGTPVDEVPVGAPVEVIFEEVGPGQLIHEWRVVSES
jgi:uncharacterized OB-fold protein